MFLPKRSISFLSSSTLFPPDKTKGRTNPGTLSSRNPCLWDMVPSTVTTISWDVKPAPLIALGIAVGSKDIPGLANTSASPLTRLTSARSTPSRRSRAFLAPLAHKPHIMPSTWTVALTTWAEIGMVERRLTNIKRNQMYFLVVILFILVLQRD